MSTPAPILQYTLNNKDLLPAGYTPLAYIESSGTLYIDTGVLPDPSTTDYLLDFLSVPGDYVYLGASISIWETAFCISSGGNSGGNTTYYILHNGAKSVCSLNGTARHFFCYFGTTANYDGNNKSISRTSLTINKNIYLFANNSNGSVGFKPSSMKCYSCRIWTEGSLVVDLRPCIQDSNGAIGMYDLVSRSFKANSGSGTFIAGPELAVGKGGGKSLPEEYLLVEYLLFTAGQYINTGLSIAVNDVLVTKANMFYKSGLSTRDLMGWSSAAADYWGVTAESAWEKVTGSNSDITKVNNVTYSYTATAAGTYQIGALTRGYSTRTKYIGYFFVSKGGTPQRVMYACYRKSDMKPGMYDTVNGVFYTNIGSGEFMLGPSITNCYTLELNAGGYWIDNTEQAIAVNTYNPLPKIKVIPGLRYILEYDVKAASNYTAPKGAILLEWFTATNVERTNCLWTSPNVALTTNYKRIHFEWTCPSGLNYVDFGKRASDGVGHTIRNIVWKLKGNDAVYSNLSTIYDSNKGWVAYGNDSSPSYIEFDKTIMNTLMTAKTFSIAFWLRVHNTNKHILFGDSSDIFPLNIEFLSSKMRYYFSASPDKVGSKTISANTWYHVVLSVTSSGFNAYVNGELDANHTSAPTFNLLTSNCRIGSDLRTESIYMGADITNFLIFDVALTDAQVKELYGK